MRNLLGERDARRFFWNHGPARASARAGIIQFASAGIGAVLAVLTGCAAVATASIGALIDALRFVVGRGAWMWIIVAGASALLVAALAASWGGGHPAAAPWMLAFGAVGLLGNAASVFAAFPHRTREFGAACARVSSWAYMLLIATGLLGIIGSIEIPLAIVVGLAAGMLSLGLVMDARGAS